MFIPIAIRELRLGFRNPWSYSFMALLFVFQAATLFIQSQTDIGGYTSVSGSLLNLILYLLPLMTILLDSFSLTSEKEDGGWSLLAAYPLSTSSFILGKYAGNAVVLTVIAVFGYGLAGLLAWGFGKPLNGTIFFAFIVFSIGLILLFLALAMIIGAFCRNRWQALTVGVTVWFVLILAWPTLLVSLLGLLPYMWVKPALIGATFLNPAELVRIFVVVRMGGGSIFGPEYYKWIRWIEQASGVWMFILVCMAWIGCALSAAVIRWERGRYHE